jgi:glycosyltransferase involved in cell wall biosynthesis
MNHKTSKKIKLTHIICSFGYGGAERLLIDLIENTDRKKYEISVLGVVSGGPLVKNLELLGVKVLIVGKKTKIGLLTIFKIYQYLKKEKPQIVHTHLFAGDTWGRISAILAGVPVIVSTEHSTNFDENIIKRLVKKNLSYFTDEIIAISETVKSHSQKYDWIKPKKIKVIYNGIDLEKFSLIDSRPGWDENEVKIGFVGRIEESKGTEYLIKAFSEINKSSLKLEIKLKIIGDGSQRKNLEAMSERLGLKKRVEFLGTKDNQKEIYQEMDILAIPSLWEGLSITALEAMAAGVPIIASNVGGLREIVKNKKTGLLVEPRNPEALAEKIIWAAENYNLMRQMAEEAKKEVENFDIESKAKEYEKVYERLLEIKNNKAIK